MESQKLQGLKISKKELVEKRGKGKEMKRRVRKEKRGWDVFNLHNFVNLMYSIEPTDSVTGIV